MAQSLQGAEPPMFLQRPTSASSQDISHILAHTFRQLFTRDVVGEDTVQYLSKSRGSEDVYHEAYVDALQTVTSYSGHIVTVFVNINELVQPASHVGN